MCFPSILSHLHFIKHHWCVCLLVKEKGILSSCPSHPCVGPGQEGRGRARSWLWVMHRAAGYGSRPKPPLAGRPRCPSSVRLKVSLSPSHFQAEQCLWPELRLLLPFANEEPNSARFCRRFSFRSETKGLYL